VDVYTKEEVLDKAREYNVKFIRLQFTDIFGLLKNIAVTVEELERALDGRVMFDSSAIEGFVGSRERDICLRPDPVTFKVFPWRPRDGAVARLICDVCLPDGEPFGGCSRSVLQRVTGEAEKMDLNLRVGAQIEFFLFLLDEQGKPTMLTHDQAGYCDVTPVDLGENARRDMVLTLEEMGFQISSSHHEVAPGQHEIFIKDDDALAMADKIVTFKFVVRTIAQRHGLHASFMPRPFAGFNGSSMCLHLGLWRGERNVFDGCGDEPGLSGVARCYIGGLIRHARSLTAIANPLVNSYKRLLPDEHSPVLVAWSSHNRNTMIKIPSPGDGESRIILRSPDAACNPYLMLAAALKAGLHGIAGDMAAPPEEGMDCVDLKELVRQKGLPRSLREALDALESDEVVKEALGGHIVERFVKVKNEEWECFQTEIHPWELKRYLANY